MLSVLYKDQDVMAAYRVKLEKHKDRTNVSRDVSSLLPVTAPIIRLAYRPVRTIGHEMLVLGGNGEELFGTPCPFMLGMIIAHTRTEFQKEEKGSLNELTVYSRRWLRLNCVREFGNIHDTQWRYITGISSLGDGSPVVFKMKSGIYNNTMTVRWPAATKADWLKLGHFTFATF